MHFNPMGKKKSHGRILREESKEQHLNTVPKSCSCIYIYIYIDYEMERISSKNEGFPSHLFHNVNIVVN